MSGLPACFLSSPNPNPPQQQRPKHRGRCWEQPQCSVARLWADQCKEMKTNLAPVKSNWFVISTSDFQKFLCLVLPKGETSRGRTFSASVHTHVLCSSCEIFRSGTFFWCKVLISSLFMRCNKVTPEVWCLDLMLHARSSWNSDPEFPSASQAKPGCSHGSSARESRSVGC